MFGINNVQPEPDSMQLRIMLKFVLGIMERKGLLHLLPNYILDYWASAREKK
jgi:hypothetical protein